ncbi:MAG: PIN domain-containing protein [Candidatus Omnitrophica bacterium]|nr:PIN domain-containing protein [Candidatus Omnitrophota bacterium]
MADKAAESKQQYFFDTSALLTRYMARENGHRTINEIFTSYSQIYTSGIIFGEVLSRLTPRLSPDKMESLIPLLIGDIKSGRLKILETRPGPVDQEAAALRAIQGTEGLGPLEVFELALIRLHLEELGKNGNQAPVFVSSEPKRSEILKSSGHETLMIEAIHA